MEVNSVSYYTNNSQVGRMLLQLWEGRGDFSMRERGGVTVRNMGREGRGDFTERERERGMDDAQGNGNECRERSKLTAIEPCDRHQRSHWLLPSDRYVMRMHKPPPPLRREGRVNFSRRGGQTLARWGWTLAWERGGWTLTGEGWGDV